MAFRTPLDLALALGPDSLLYSSMFIFGMTAFVLLSPVIVLLTVCSSRALSIRTFRTTSDNV